ncbi:Periplasmic protein involved in polysaccharide export, contains SLBB domain of b-grasp fold [Methylacidiphilum infernorum V4]|uniref:Periplasmic protein involved in polysaccharide export, contains SLBB domain of b-grasp fold n=1 Tax=Methylacidiphilum infernorum (isolate V4) TaxID=481448 RepID=B3DZL0_METI4|nr:Periplasmic protein involved in polysaccharide export, contains SLBB domain of b-grasp fold [Methylacidiphilum infernorum V4]
MTGLYRRGLKKKGILLLSSFFLFFLGMSFGKSSKDIPQALPATAEDANSKINEIILMQASQTADKEGVPLGDGDLLEIHVADLPELSNIKTRITPAGTILLPLLGQIQVEGLTAEELHAFLKTKLGEKYLRDPQVSVSVVEMKSHRISVMGAVYKPGVYEMTNQLRVVDALGMAGGLREDASTTIYLIRSPKKRKAENSPPKAGNEMNAGEEKKEPKAEAPVGPPPKVKKEELLSQIKPFIVEIDLKEMIDGKSERSNFLLMPGDVIQVPPAGSVYVGGEVKNPKGVPLRGGVITAYQAIIEAGGPNDKADMSKVKIYRKLPNGQKKVILLDLSRKKRDYNDYTLQKEDVVVVGTNGPMAVLVGIRDTIFSRLFLPMPY